MAITPSAQDKNREAELKRMHKIANGPDGKDRMKTEFGMDLEKGPLPKVVAQADDPSKRDSSKPGAADKK